MADEEVPIIEVRRVVVQYEIRTSFAPPTGQMPAAGGSTMNEDAVVERVLLALAAARRFRTPL